MFTHAAFRLFDTTYPAYRVCGSKTCARYTRGSTAFYSLPNNAHPRSSHAREARPEWLR